MPILLLLVSAISVAAEEPVGRRPYEMQWGNRTEDVRTALVDFEDLKGWTVECLDSVATFACSREQQLWGRYVGRLAYRGTGPRARLTLKPPRPISLPEKFNCVNVWVYGNNWAWAPEPATPPVEIAVLLQGADGSAVSVTLGQVRWKEWWPMHARLSSGQLASLGRGGVLTGIRISGGRNRDERLPVAQAFSYLVKPGELAEMPLKCERAQVVPGESVTIVGKTQHTLRVPADASPGTQLWQQFSDVGAADDSSGDWSCWAGMRIESRRPTLRTSVRDAR